MCIIIWYKALHIDPLIGKLLAYVVELESLGHFLQVIIYPGKITQTAT